MSLRSTPAVADPKLYGEIQTARKLEEARDVDAAIDAYLRGGAHREAARLLSFEGRYLEAAEALLQGLPAEPTPVSHLTADGRRDALNAALCFARGGARVECISLLVNLGETERAAALLTSTGRRSEAVQAMKGEVPKDSPWPAGFVFPLQRHLTLPKPAPEPELMTLPPEAMEPIPPPPQPFEDDPDPLALETFRGPVEPVADPLVDALIDPLVDPPADPFEDPTALPDVAALPPDPLSLPFGFLEASSPEPASDVFELPPAPELLDPASGSMPGPELAALLSADPEEPEYGKAVAATLRTVWKEDRLSRRASLFLDTFIRRASETEVPPEMRAAVYATGRLFEFHDRLDAAQRAYAAVLRGDAGFSDASYRLGNLRAGLAEAGDGCWHPVQLLISGLHQFGNLPSLSDLPPLEDEPPRLLDSLPSMPVMRPVTRPPEPMGPAIVTDSLRRLKEGIVIAERYRIEASIGTGGMATVYRALDLELEEMVALKLFRNAGQSEDGLARFRREMKLSRKLNHPNIVHIYEFGTWHGLHFITMELLEGRDLSKLASTYPRGRMDPLEVARLMIQACEGLGAAHEGGVVHRDVKPQNFFVSDDGSSLKVMDFGIAKAQSSATISVTGVRLGTPRYMSPEQIEGGKDVGPAADLYSLGVVMYEVLTGVPPFSGDTLVRLLLSHISEPPRPPRELVPEIPEALEAVVLRLLAKEPEHRYADCASAREALSAVLPD